MKEETPMNTRKQQIVDCGSGKFMLRTYNKKAEHYDERDLDVQKFESRFSCHPIEAHTFYPEQFSKPYTIGE